MDRQCDVCDVTYTAKRASSKYCSTRCRTRKSRGTVPAKVIPLAPTSPKPEGAVESGVAAATETALNVAGVLDSPLGQACLVLARRLDRPGLDNGSAVSAVAARLEDLLTKATKGAGAKSAPQQLRDELADRRRHA